MSDIQVGERIKELRKVHGYPRTQLAEQIGISEKFLYEIETGKKSFSADTLCGLAKALSVSCDYIMFGEDAERRGAASVWSVLEKLDAKQLGRIRDLLILLSRICDAV